MFPRTICALMAGLLMACAAGSPSVGKPSSPPPRKPSKTQPANGPAEADATPFRLSARDASGKTVLLRSGLKRLKALGPHWLLQRVAVRPTFHRGRFRGWRIDRYSGPVKLKRGDIIKRVNNSTMERPEQFMKVWNTMTERDTLVVELVRGAKPRSYSYSIVEKRSEQHQNGR